MFYYQGYIYFSMEDYGRAETAYKNLIAEPDSNDQEVLGALYSLSQLAYIGEDYRKSIDYLLQWYDLEEMHSSDECALLSMTFYQFEDFQLYLNNFAKHFSCIGKEQQQKQF